MSLSIPSSYAINPTQQLALFEDGTGFVFKDKKLLFDFHYELIEDTLDIVYNDDASWAELKINEDILEGVLYSHLVEKKVLRWELKEQAMIAKPEPKNMLQAVRFHDLSALKSYEETANIKQWSEMLIEAATCGHEQIVKICLEYGACLGVDSDFNEEKDASSMALIKAIQYGHEAVVKALLDAHAKIHHHSFDLDRDALYHACFLYQVRPDKGSAIIKMLLECGVDFSTMSGYYLAAVIYTFPNGPLEPAQEDTEILQLFIDAGARVDDFLAVNAWAKDTPFMFAAHMGLFKPLKVLQANNANVFECFEGQNALDRLLHPLVVDPLMPHQANEAVKSYLELLGLTQSEAIQTEKLQEQEELSQATPEDIENLKNLFKTL